MNEPKTMKARERFVGASRCVAFLTDGDPLLLKHPYIREAWNEMSEAYKAWIEAEVPVPETPTVEGRVVDE